MARAVEVLAMTDVYCFGPLALALLEYTKAKLEAHGKTCTVVETTVGGFTLYELHATYTHETTRKEGRGKL